MYFQSSNPILKGSQKCELSNACQSEWNIVVSKLKKRMSHKMSVGHLLCFCVIPWIITSVKIAYPPANSTEAFPTWGNLCDTGTMQSPINITEVQKSVYYEGTAMLYKYSVPLYKLDVFNTGNSIEIGNFPMKTKIRFSMFSNAFLAHHLQFHWSGEHMNGPDDANALEMQIIHRNELYDTLDEAFTHDDGVLVLSVRFIVGEEGYEFFNEIEEDLKFVQNMTHIEHMVRIRSGKRFDLDRMLHGSDAAYYVGSMTTPPCQENVSWIVVLDEFVVSSQILEQFKLVEDETGSPIERNNRIVQPLNNRTISRIRIINKTPFMSRMSSATSCICNAVIILFLPILALCATSD